MKVVVETEIVSLVQMLMSNSTGGVKGKLLSLKKKDSFCQMWLTSKVGELKMVLTEWKRKGPYLGAQLSC